MAGGGRIEFENNIRVVLNETAPFGPIDATKITDPEVASLLFDRQIESIRHLLTKNFLVGRRGAGKSAILNAQTRKPSRNEDGANHLMPTRPAYDYAVMLHAWKEFPSIQKLISDFDQSYGGNLPVEWMAEKWEAVFWFYIAREIQQKTPAELQHFGVYRDVAQMIGSKTERAAGLDAAIRKIVESGPDPTLMSHAREVLFEFSTERLREACVKFLQINGRRAIVTLDTMEQYPIREKPLQATLNGMMRAVARINGMSPGVRIIFCLPSEIYAHFYAQSSNPLKDFDSVDFLHWSAKGLLQVAAFRYRLFLELCDKPSYDLVASLDIHDRRGLRNFWSTFLPEKVTNGMGVDEAPLAYLVRHTQLLPRQLLKIMNELAVRSHARTGGWRYFPEDIIRQSVRDNEGIIASEVFSAFQSVYPEALRACRATMSRLTIEPKYGEIQRHWRSHAKPLMEQMGFHDFHDFIEMMSEIGVIGKASAKRPDSDRYIFADFEYRAKDRLILDDTHRICVHPVFYGLFQVDTKAGQKTVYPNGTDIDDDQDD
jgi:hypothetical protein